MRAANARPVAHRACARSIDTYFELRVTFF
jgi:hypothetical protein